MPYRSLVQRAGERFPPQDGFRVTESLIEDIKKELKHGRANPVKIATKFGVPSSLVRYIESEIPNPNTEFTRHSDDGWGRIELRRYIIARQLAGEAWSDADEDKIAEARKQYDDGLVEICRGRDGDFILLYAITRKRPIKRGYKYFEELEMAW